MSEVEKNVEGSVVNCESLVDVIKRDFGNQYLEWKKVWFKSQFFPDKAFQRSQVWKFLVFFQRFPLYWSCVNFSCPEHNT